MICEVKRCRPRLQLRQRLGALLVVGQQCKVRSASTSGGLARAGGSSTARAGHPDRQERERRRRPLRHRAGFPRVLQCHQPDRPTGEEAHADAQPEAQHGVSTALALERTLSSAQFRILPRCAIFGSAPVPDTSLGQARWIFLRVKALLRSGSVGVVFVSVLRVGSSDG
ncbi:hypothetical protein T492DRAFT_445449 [Pavlovales sp. CCMP2436]|nr:hypothetical protein T492DRAFT_445449 [Pavlovales sp. CCMP2436]